MTSEKIQPVLEITLSFLLAPDRRSDRPHMWKLQAPYRRSGTY